MAEQVKDDQWVWVLIQNPGGNETIVGQQYEEEDVSFIPAFLDKEEALKGYHRIVRKAGVRDEFQAILFEDLAGHAADNAFEIFLLNGTGDILERIPVPNR